MNKLYIAYKERYEFCSTKNVTWEQRLAGPFNTPDEINEIVSDLYEVGRLGDVKDIKVLTEYLK